MPSITTEEMHILIELRERARNVWQQARLIKATQRRDLVRSDMSMQRLYEALQRADGVSFKGTRKRT